MSPRTLAMVPLLAALALGACGDDDDPAAGTAATECSPADSEISVTGDDKLAFDKATYTAAAGCLEITLVNDGVIAHSLLVEGVLGFMLEVGDTDTGSLSLDPGTYRIYCDLPGHEAAGMEAELTLT